MMQILIQISLFSLIQIGILRNLFKLMLIMIRIRSLLLIKVMQIWDNWSSYPPRLSLEPPCLHCKCSEPSMAPFWASTTPEFWIFFGSGSGFDFDADPNLASQIDTESVRVWICCKKWQMISFQSPHPCRGFCHLMQTGDQNPNF
jgi:hypothetical protein